MKLYFLLPCLLLAGCLNLPPAIKDTPSIDITYQQVNQNPAKYLNAPVRWGGAIIDVENEQTFSLIQVLLYPLNNYGKPQLSEPSQGRFFIKSPDFLDPAVYIKNKEITVAGTLKEEMIRTIGKKNLHVPVVSATTIYLWPHYDNSYYYPGPYGYGFNPYFGYSPYFGFNPYSWGGYYRAYPYYW